MTQSGGGPSAFVANHCIGNAGTVTLSKFSTEVTRPAHGGHRPRLGRIPATIGPLAMAPAISSMNKIKFRSRVDVSVYFMLSLMITGLGEVPGLAETAVSAEAWVYTVAHTN